MGDLAGLGVRVATWIFMAGIRMRTKRPDLAITTDFRHVLAEIMRQHRAACRLADQFPDFTPEAVGLYA